MSCLSVQTERRRDGRTVCRIEVDLELLQVLASQTEGRPDGSPIQFFFFFTFPRNQFLKENVAFQVLGAAGAPRGRRSAARISGGPTRKKSTYPSSSRPTDSSECARILTRLRALPLLIGREFRGAIHPSEMRARPLIGRRERKCLFPSLPSRLCKCIRI